MSTLSSAMSSAASALDVQRVRMEVAISNMANADSTRGPNNEPYRRRDVVLEAITEDPTTGARSGDRVFGVRVAEIVEDQEAFRRRFEPSNPDAGPDGHVAVPNVDVPDEMVNLLGASRAYQANLAAITVIRDTIQKAIEIGRA